MVTKDQPLEHAHFTLIVEPKRCNSNNYTLFKGIDYGQPWRRTFGDNITYTDWHKDNYYHVVKQQVGDAKHVGLEFDHVSLDSHKMFSEAMPKANFSDIGQPTMRMRLIKSPEEIELIKHGARVADLGGETVVKALKENVPEYEVALASTEAMVHEIADSFPHSEIMNSMLSSYL